LRAVSGGRTRVRAAAEPRVVLRDHGELPEPVPGRPLRTHRQRPRGREPAGARGRAERAGPRGGAEVEGGLTPFARKRGQPPFARKWGLPPFRGAPAGAG